MRDYASHRVTRVARVGVCTLYTREGCNTRDDDDGDVRGEGYARRAPDVSARKAGRRMCI